MFKLKQVLVLILVFHYVKIQCENIERSKNPSIIIVGAGPSGIAAASKLLKNNVTNIKILEAEDRIGGRINSIKFGDAIIEMGAEFCHGETDNIVYELVKEYNILKGSKDSFSKGYFSNGQQMSTDLLNKTIEFFYSLYHPDKIEACKSVKSFGDCLDICYEQLLNNTMDVKERALLKNFKELFENTFSGTASSYDLHDLSIYSNFEESQGDLYLSWNGQGYKIILDILMQKYPATDNSLPIDDKIILNKEVVKISKWDQDDIVEVTCKDGSIYTADQVLFSPSLGVLKAEHIKLFEPALPETKVEAINNLGYGTIMKIFLMFSKATNLNFELLPVFEKDEFKSKNKHLRWLTALGSLVPTENNPKIIHGWYSGIHIPKIEELSDEEIAEGQKYVVDRFLRPLLNVSKPEKIVRTKWLTNPHFRGSYSYESSKAPKSGKEYYDELAKPLRNNHNKPTVALIGEATNSRHYSTVHGAIESGFREAQRILDNYVTFNK